MEKANWKKNRVKFQNRNDKPYKLPERKREITFKGSGLFVAFNFSTATMKEHRRTMFSKF